LGADQKGIEMINSPFDDFLDYSHSYMGDITLISNSLLGELPVDEPV
jgi:hypothetical protein